MDKYVSTINYKALISSLSKVEVISPFHEDSITLIIGYLKRDWRIDQIENDLKKRELPSLKNLMHHYNVDFSYLEESPEFMVLTLDSTDEELDDLANRAMYVDGPFPEAQASMMYKTLKMLSNRYLVRIVKKEESI